MPVQVRSPRATVHEAINAHIERQLQFGLGRFIDRIRELTVQIVDLNGPRGGEDTSCRIEVRLRPRGRVFVEETAGGLYAAVHRATHRVTRSVARTIARTRDSVRNARRPRSGA